MNGDECTERGEHAAENAADARAGRACIAFCYHVDLIIQVLLVYLIDHFSFVNFFTFVL